MHIARVYAVGPQIVKLKEEMKSQHEDIMNEQRALCMKNNINANVCELNYIHVQY